MLGNDGVWSTFSLRKRREKVCKNEAKLHELNGINYGTFREGKMGVPACFAESEELGPAARDGCRGRGLRTRRTVTWAVIHQCIDSSDQRMQMRPRRRQRKSCRTYLRYSRASSSNVCGGAGARLIIHCPIRRAALMVTRLAEGTCTRRSLGNRLVCLRLHHHLNFQVLKRTTAMFLLADLSKRERWIRPQ
jgi:hypothetical protein